MTLLAKLNRAYAHFLDEGQAIAIQEHLRREETRMEFAVPSKLDPIEAQSGFILFDREFADEPKHLFGQDVPSLAHTHVRVYRSRLTSGELLPGDEIFAARISEKALTEAMLLSNRGECQPMTVTRLGDCELPPLPRTATRTERAASAYEAEEADRIADALSALDREIATGITRSSPGLRDAVSNMAYRARDLKSVKFSLERHLEEMSRTRSEVLTEAAHAALHADKVAAALSRPRLALPTPRAIAPEDLAAEHPMVDMILDPMPAALREAIRILLVERVRTLSDVSPRMSGWIVNDGGVETLRIASPRDRSIAIGRDQPEGVREEIEQIDRIWNWAFNSHIEAARAERSTHQAGMSVSQRSGWLGAIHSTLPPTEGSYFAISFRAATEILEHGGSRLRTQGAPLVEIEMVAEDLMTALRGHPDGHPVPCSIRLLCGISPGHSERPRHSLSLEIDDIAKEIGASPEFRELDGSIAALQGLVASKRSGKTWRAEVLAAAERASAAFSAAEARVGSDVGNGRAIVSTRVAESASAMLRSISKSLPDDALRTLRLIEK